MKYTIQLNRYNYNMTNGLNMYIILYMQMVQLAQKQPEIKLFIAKNSGNL